MTKIDAVGVAILSSTPYNLEVIFWLAFLAFARILKAICFCKDVWLFTRSLGHVYLLSQVLHSAICRPGKVHGSSILEIFRPLSAFT